MKTLVDLGRELAKHYVKMDRKIEEIIDKNDLNFDVWEEDGKIYITIAYCNVGGCDARKIEFSTWEEAKRQAALMTYFGEKPGIVGICGECRNEAANETTCYRCGGELMPVYDEHPNWLKFCPRCDKWVD